MSPLHALLFSHVFTVAQAQSQGFMLWIERLFFKVCFLHCVYHLNLFRFLKKETHFTKKTSWQTVLNLVGNLIFLAICIQCLLQKIDLTDVKYSGYVALENSNKQQRNPTYIQSPTCFSSFKNKRQFPILHSSELVQNRFAGQFLFSSKNTEYHIDGRVQLKKSPFSLA